MKTRKIKTRISSVKITKEDLADSFLIELGQIYSYLEKHPNALRGLNKSDLEDVLHRFKLFNNHLFQKIGYKPSFKIPMF